MRLLLISLKKDRVLSNKQSYLFWMGVVLFCMLVAFLKELILPSYFFFDSVTLESFVGFEWQVGSAYSSTAKFYEMFFLAENHGLISLLSVFFILIVCLKSVSVSDAIILRPSSVFLFVFFVFLSVVYMTIISKEFVVLILNSVLIFAHGKKHEKLSVFFWFLLAFFYAYAFRSYWVLFVFQILVLYVGYSYINSHKKLFLFVAISIFSISFTYFLLSGENIDSFRVLYNEARLDRGGASTSTLILPWFGIGGFLVAFLNSFVTWVSFFIPFKLISLLSPYYLFISLMLMLFFYRLFNAALTLSGKGGRGRLYCSIIISFTIIQAVFEPDYGSFIRHLTPFSPLIFYVLAQCDYEELNREGCIDENSACS